MATRTVRLDPEAESILQELRRATGLPISAVLKAGLRAFRDQLGADRTPVPYDVFAALDLGPGGYAVAPSTETARGMRAVLERKHGRRG